MTVIIDEYNLQPYPDAFYVTDDSSFVMARQKILAYKMDGERGKSIVVTTYPYTEWFHDVERESNILFKRILPSHKLQERFANVDFDKDLDESDIVQLDLLHQSIEPTELSIINKYIGTFLLGSSDLKQQLFEITAYVANPTKLFITSKYLQKKWVKYLDRIISESSVIQALISKIKDQDPDFCKVINLLIYVSNSQYLLRELLHDYKDYLESTLRKQTPDLARFLSESQFQVLPNEQYESKIEIVFKTLYKEDISAFFDEKSEYKASLRAFLSIAKSVNVKEKEFIFSNYRRNLDYELEDKIRSLIKPELLAPPDVKYLSLPMQIDAWQQWAVRTFIPFKFYLDDFPNEKEIKLVEEYSSVYSDWLFDSYEAILQSGLKTNYNIVNIIHDHLPDHRIVWLIIDGFPAAYVEALNSILKSNGINKITDDYHFAAIPTITSIGIPTQLSGIYPQSKTYTTNKEESLKLAFSSQKITFRNSIKTFGDALESDFDVCCLHWHEIDEFMHKDDNNIDTTRIDEIKRLLNNRIKQISNFIKSNSDRKIKLIVSTDHGSTKCLLKGQKINNSSLLEACKDDPKERCVKVTGALSKVNLDENEIYYLRAEKTMNAEDWVVAKGYRYFGRFDYGYRHGGLTPEETIIPFLICEIAQQEILPLKVLYGGFADLQLGFTENLKLILINDNDAVLEITNILIQEDKNFSFDGKQSVDPLGSKVFEGRIKLPKSTPLKEGKAHLNVIIYFSVLGGKHHNTCSVIIPIKKSVNDNLDNLFS